MAKLLNLQIIFSEEKLVGDGKTEPYRRVRQYFSTDGTLLLEYDNLTDKSSMVINLIRHLEKLSDSDINSLNK